jgi:hypothetical protein
MTVMTCEEKGFSVEVAGVSNPENPPFFLSTSVDIPGKNWCCLPKDSQDSPHTIYTTELTVAQARDQHYKLFLNAPGLKKALQVYPAPDDQGVMPTGYKAGKADFQDYIFIPFRPVTAILNQKHPRSGAYDFWGYGEDAGQPMAEDAQPNDPQCHLRLLRKGYLYIFREKKLWREIEVFQDGTLLDIDLEEPRKEKLDERLSHAQKGETSEIWLPFRYGATTSSSYSRRAGDEFRIAFSEKQWSWSYIEWLEDEDIKVNTRRLDSLDSLYYLYTISSKNEKEFPPRFTPIIKETGFGGKFYPVKAERANLTTEAIGVSIRLLSSPEWDRGESWSKKNNTSDWRIFQSLFPGYSPPNYDDVDGYTKEIHADSVFGSGVSKGRGLFFVHDYLYSPLFHAARVIFYADLLTAFDHELVDKPYASTVWQILNSLRSNEEERTKIASNLRMDKIEGIIIPKLRKAVRMMVEEAISDLHNCMNDFVGPVDSLPGATWNTKGIGYALHDLFTLEGEEYVSGWAWVKNIAAALAIDTDTIDTHCLPPERKYGAKSDLFKKSTIKLRGLPEMDCNGITLQDMMYPKLSKYPVEIPLTLQGIEDNDGKALCRYAYLHQLVKDNPQKDEIITIISGVGLISYQANFEEFMGAVSRPTVFPDALKAPVNLLRLDPELKDMVLSRPSDLLPNRQLPLILGMYSPASTRERYTPKSSFVPRADGTGHDEYVIGKVNYDQYVVRKKIKGSTNQPLLVVQVESATLLKWGSVNLDLANVSGAFRARLGILYIPLSALNLISCKESWQSGNKSDSIGLALSVGDALVKLATGTATATSLIAAARARRLGAVIFDGAAFAGKSLRIALKLGSLVGALDSGWNWHKSIKDGDTGAAWAYGIGAVAFSFIFVLNPIGLAATICGVLGVGCSALGFFLTTDDLTKELLRKNIYAKEKDYWSPATGQQDDEAMRLLRYACPISVQKVLADDPTEPIAKHLNALGLRPKTRKILRVSWPMFTDVSFSSQITGELAAEYLFIEETHEVFVLPCREGYTAIISHIANNEKRKFATIADGDITYEYN